MPVRLGIFLGAILSNALLEKSGFSHLNYAIKMSILISYQMIVWKHNTETRPSSGFWSACVSWVNSVTHQVPEKEFRASRSWIEFGLKAWKNYSDKKWQLVG